MRETSLDGLLGGDATGLPDHELVEAMTAARAIASHAQAIELAAVAELARRRYTEDDVSAVEVISPRDYLTEEVAQALTLTSASAEDLLRFATELVGRLPGTFAALAAGDIDYSKARTLWRCVDQVSDEVAAEIEMRVLPRAAMQTTGEIRAKVRRLVKRLDPQALRDRCEAAQRRREVTLVETDDGTAHLVGADLPADAAGAAYGRVSAIAAGLKRDGDSRGIDQLRADVFVALLRGTLTATESPADTTVRSLSEQAGRCDVADRRDAGWSGVDDAVADVIAAAARAEFTGLASDLPDRHRRLGVLIAQAGVRVTEALTALRAPWCLSDHDGSRHGDSGRDVAGPDVARHGLPGGVPGRNGSQSAGQGYRVPVAVRRLIECRDRRCCFPGCRRPVRHCDADHSTPFHRGGATCPCNLALLCRRHHRLKQTKGWRVEHLWPGVILWIGPTGHWRISAPADRE
ncbi:MAG: DUF222 domain-containing protein [Actinoallomurus sp.]